MAISHQFPIVTLEVKTNQIIIRYADEHGMAQYHSVLAPPYVPFYFLSLFLFPSKYRPTTGKLLKGKSCFTI